MTHLSIRESRVRRKALALRWLLLYLFRGHAQQASEICYVARWDGIKAKPASQTRPPTDISGNRTELKEARLRLSIQLGTYPQLRTCAKSDEGLKHWACPPNYCTASKTYFSPWSCVSAFKACHMDGVFTHFGGGWITNASV